MDLHHPTAEGSPEWAAAIIRKEVAALLRRTRTFGEAEREDLLNDCLEHWLRQRALYDGSRGASLTTFLKRITANKLKDLVRSEERRTRLAGRSLNEALGRDGAELGELLPSADLPPLAALEQQEFVARIREVYRNLNLADRRVARAVATADSKDAAAKALGISRPALYRVLARIEADFREFRR